MSGAAEFQEARPRILSGCWSRFYVISLMKIATRSRASRLAWILVISRIPLNNRTIERAATL
jgi:hypothetical protein